MRSIRRIALMGLGLSAAFAAFAQDAPVKGKGRVFRAGAGHALPTSAKATKLERLSDFLRTQGVSAVTVSSIRKVSEATSRNGMTQLRVQQEVSGLRVYDAYAKAAFNGKGELVHVIDGLAAVPRSLDRARVSEAQALKAALARVYPGVKGDLAAVGRASNVVTYAKTPFFHAAPRVERVAVAMASGAMKTGFLVETWSEAKNQLHETLVSGEGAVLSVQSRSNSDSYSVFTVDPVTTPQAVVAGPGAGNAQSPAGWLFGGDQNSISISGNNVHSYLDAKSNNNPDRGGVVVSDGRFLTDADLETTPSSTGSREVAGQNLFYLSNVIHDGLRAAGFTEAAGNFQEDNFGNGGLGGDSVDAEAEDGGGIDNANFTTPPDGSHPRMQMYLWTGKGSRQVAVNAPFAATYRAEGAVFGKALNAAGITGDVVLVDDGTGVSSDGCQAITNAVSDKIALIDRGGCGFVVKVANAQAAGAVAAIVANNAGDSIFTMGGTDHSIHIPSVFIGLTDGSALKAGLPANATVRLTEPAPLQRDGDLDSDIVWHEYGHGLTWRMIGDMDGPLAGAIGEGMSDVLAVIANENDVVGEYAFDDPRGIRNLPYTNYPLSYG